MKDLWETKCELCGFPLADHVYRNTDDGKSEFIERQWDCPTDKRIVQ